MNKQWMNVLRLAITAMLIACISVSTWAGKGGTRDVPIGGVANGFLIDFNTIPATWPPGRCDNTPDGFIPFSLTSFDGWGDLSHLGWSYLLAEHCSYMPLDPTGPQGTYGQGTLTVTADNGDVLVGTYDNGVSLSPPPFIGFMDYITFTDGGTGRFTYAAGNAVEVGLFNVVDGSFTVQMQGTISYKRKMK